MSTKATLATSNGGEPSWHLYEEVFESGVVYLELRGIPVELVTRESGGADVVLRLPIETAEQLGLHSIVPGNLWAIACDRDKGGAIGQPKGSVRRFEQPSQDEDGSGASGFSNGA